ncbi:hypothetical protein C8R44DRAFT_378915 [Mycena epipterygia]|nr:hypothetical protein C8R44DRAFT_378915 [Mycena epipterygia]
MSDGDLYSRLLLTKGHGYPLSHPQPFDDLPDEIRMKGTKIGDVGILTPDGSFDVFFNICRESDDPVNRFGVPYGFETVYLGSGDVASMASYHRPGSHVSNTTISKRRLDMDAGVENNVFLPVGAGAVVEISTSSKRTAVLLLPDGASRTNLRFPDKFRDHALKHAQAWYDFLSGLGHMVENGELYLVTGVDKSASWSVAAVENYAEDCSVSLKLKAAQIGSAGASYTWEWETVAAFADSGPRRLPGEELGAKNQTVFLRGFRIAIRSLPWGKIPKAIPIVDSKPTTNVSETWFRTLFSRSPSRSTQNVSRGRSTGHDVLRDEESESIVYSPAIHRPYHPADAINKYLITDSSSDLVAVVTHDDEWMSVLREDEDVPTDSELIRRICEKYTMGSTSDGEYLEQRTQESRLFFPFHIASLPKFGHRKLHTYLVLVVLLGLFPYRSICSYFAVATSVLFWVYAEYYRLHDRMKRLQSSFDLTIGGLNIRSIDLTVSSLNTGNNPSSHGYNGVDVKIWVSACHIRKSMSRIRVRLPCISETWAPQFSARVEIWREIRKCEQELQRIQERQEESRREQRSNVESSHM